MPDHDCVLQASRKTYHSGISEFVWDYYPIHWKQCRIQDELIKSYFCVCCQESKKNDFYIIHSMYEEYISNIWDI